MIEFSKQISEKWSISQVLSDLICNAYERGDTPYYLAEYSAEIVAELTISIIWEIYDFLKAMEELITKKKRLINAYKKADILTPLLEKRINLTSNPYELDDMLIPLRPNPRSKGQLAVKKGLEPLADFILKQEEEKTPVEVLAESYVGKDPSLKTVEDVIQGVKDVLAERIAYDDTVRAMAREFAYDDGYFDITPKNKKDPRFVSYIGKNVPILELSKQELLTLAVAEDKKDARVKLGVQLFRITELVRHHFITNPDSVGFDLICQTIDDSWERLLQPIIERDVKERLRNEAEEWAVKLLVADLEKKYAEELSRGPFLFVDTIQKKSLLLLAISGQGNLLGATTEKIQPEGKSPVSERLRQFLNRHKPATIVVRESENGVLAESIVKQNLNSTDTPVSFIHHKSEPDLKTPAKSEWMEKKFSTLLDEQMRELYGIALVYVQPVSLLSQIGTDYYSIHQFQNIITPARFNEVITRIITYASVSKGVIIKDVVESPLTAFSCVKPELLQNIRAADSKEPFASKDDLLKVPGMNELIFRNIAGFIIIPNASEQIDRSLVHPDFYNIIYEVSEELTASLETIVNDPAILRSYQTEDFVQRLYVEKKLIPQVEVAQRFIGQASQKVKRKLKLNELKEGTVVSGRVTNITPFGVFVNINAVCDGLIHISQLADEYVETPEQVVAVNDRVDVRILKVDVKKRRISLSMKNLGNKSPRVRPTTKQLDNLADHFKNR